MPFTDNLSTGMIRPRSPFCQRLIAPSRTNKMRSPYQHSLLNMALTAYLRGG